MKTQALRLLIRPILIAAAVALFATIRTPAAAQNASFTQPGLIQAYFENSDATTVWETDVVSHPTAEQTPGINMADHGHYLWWQPWEKETYGSWVNPYSGNRWRWAENNNGYGYTGQMWVEKDVTYTFGIYFNIGVAITIDGKYIESWSDGFKTANYTATATGWVDLDVRLYYDDANWHPLNWVGACGDAWDFNTWGWMPNGLGVAFNTAGITAAYPLDIWSNLYDSGYGDFLRTPGSPLKSAPVVSLDGAGFRLSTDAMISTADYYALAGYNGVYAISNIIQSANAWPAAVSTNYTGLATNTSYTAAVLALGVSGNVVGASEIMPSSDVFHTGELRLEFERDAHESGITGIVKVRRDGGADSVRLPLAVNYSFAGITATEGVNYAKPAGTIVIEENADYAEIIITPITVGGGGATSLNVSLEPGLYYFDPAPVEVAIGKLSIDPAYNTWIAAADGNASEAANWSYNSVPTSTDKIMIGTFSDRSMFWDAGVNGLPDSVASWTQTEFYTNSVTFPTTYSDTQSAFTNFTVAGNVALDGGIWTHPENPAGNTEVYRLRVSVGGDFSIGAEGNVNVKYKGYAIGYFHPGSAFGTHGGSRTDFGQVYGNVYEPVNLGSGGQYSNAGGGAFYLTVAGAAVIDGAVNASSFESDNKWCGDRSPGAGGSVYIRATTIDGAGKIAANGSPSQSTAEQGGYASSGGRIALVATGSAPIGIPLANIRASGDQSRSGQSAGAGTVFLKTAAQTHGSLLIQSNSVNDRDPSDDNGVYYFLPTRYGTTPVPNGETWTFDEIITAGRGILSVAPGATIKLPGGFASVRSTDAGLGDGILYLGGAIDTFGQPDIFQNNWIFHVAEPYAFAGNVTVQNNGALGVLPLRSTLDNYSASEYVIPGNLTVETGSRISATRAGVDWDNKPNTTHGGQPCWLGDPHGDGWGSWSPGDYFNHSIVYGSILNPVHPGSFGANVMSSDASTRNPGSGVIILRVGGAFHLDGNVEVYASDFGGYPVSGGGGGSANITAGTLTGAGKIDASGYRINSSSEWKYGGAPGRISVRLKAPGADFSGFGATNITAHGFSGGDARTMTSAGTVYLETREDGPGGGTVMIWNDGIPANNSTFTPFPSQSYGGETDDFKKARLDIGQAARVKLFNSVRVKDATTRAGTLLDLNGFTLSLDKLVLEDRKVMFSGVFTAAQLIALGYSGITDTDPEAAGLVKLIPASSLIVLR